MWLQKRKYEPSCFVQLVKRICCDQAVTRKSGGVVEFARIICGTHLSYCKTNGQDGDWEGNKDRETLLNKKLQARAHQYY